MNANIAIVDIETTGLDADRHVPWEVALAVGDSHYCWLLALDSATIAAADPIALSIGRFHERHPQGNIGPPILIEPGSNAVWPKPAVPLANPAHVAQEVARLTHGKHLVGAVPSFDEERLRMLLHEYGYSPSWHYHLIDVETLAVGWLRGALDADDERLDLVRTLPWKSEDLSRAIGVDPDQFEKHTALGDVKWAQTIWEAIMGEA